jgi:hypothetical protein
LVLVAQGRQQTTQMVVMVVILYLAVLHLLVVVVALMALVALLVEVLVVVALLVELKLAGQEHLVKVLLEAQAVQEMLIQHFPVLVVAVLVQ